jgi:hypothetical protein
MWAATFVIFVVLSFGSTLMWEGRDLGVPLPYRILAELPVLRTARAPSRFIFVAALGLGVLVAIALSELDRRVRSLGARLSLLATTMSLLVFEYLAVPFPTVKAPTSTAFTRLAQEPNDSALLEVPLGWRDAFIRKGAEDIGLAAAQTIHERRRIGGVIARADPRHVELLERLPLVRELLEIQNGDRASVVFVGEREHRDACELARRVPVGNVLISRHWRDTAAHRYVRDAMPLDLIADDGAYTAYRVAPERCADLDALPRVVMITDPGVRLGEGWSFIEGAEAATRLASPWVWSTGRAEVVVNAYGRRPQFVRVQGFLAQELVDLRTRVRVVIDDAVAYDDVASGGLLDIEKAVDSTRTGDVTITIETSQLWEAGGRHLGFVLKAIGWR